MALFQSELPIDEIAVIVFRDIGKSNGTTTGRHVRRLDGFDISSYAPSF